MDVEFWMNKCMDVEFAPSLMLTVKYLHYKFLDGITHKDWIMMVNLYIYSQVRLVIEKYSFQCPLPVSFLPNIMAFCKRMA